MKAETGHVPKNRQKSSSGRTPNSLPAIQEPLNMQVATYIETAVCPLQSSEDRTV